MKMKILTVLTTILLCSSITSALPNYSLLEGILRRLIFQPRLQFRRQSTLPSPYKLTEWSTFTNCSKICGGGVQQRSRICTDLGGNEVLMKFCNNNPISSIEAFRRFLSGNEGTSETETVSCNQQECETSAWSEWSKCTRVCGGGQQFASRDCLESTNDQSQCRFTSMKIQFCNLQPCFQMSEWSEYSNCSRHCGDGLKTRTRNCEITISESEPQYLELKSVLDKLDFNPFDFHVQRNKLDFHYVLEFVKNCQVNRKETAICTNQPCPECENNQIFHQCKPCHQSCYQTDVVEYFSNFHNTSSYFTQILQQNFGCNNECESGCGCPLLEPYLGSDGICYRFPFECPTNRQNVLFLLPEDQPEPDVVPEQKPEVFPVLPEPELVISPAKSKEPFPVQPEVNDITELPECLTNVMIATRPGFIPCNCKGKLESTSCFLSEGTSCPVVCRNEKRGLKCPGNEMVAILKSFGGRCPKSNGGQTCQNDDECAMGKLCCKTRCGMMCVNGRM